MAHFAKIENNIVTQVIVVSNADCGNFEFPESEAVGQNFISNIGIDGVWKQTSYNATFRKKFAWIGDNYNETLDAFISAKVYESWTLDESTCTWKPPVEKPNNGIKYIWNEETKTWEQPNINNE